MTFMALAALLLAAAGYCDDTPPSGPKKCESKFPDIFKDICWDCMFPVRIGGNVIMNAANMPDNIASATGNADDYNPDSYGCSCEVDGKTYIGVYVSFWEPARVLEVIPQSGCFSFLFGMDLSKSLASVYGTKGKAPVTPLEKSFQHVHYYNAPLLEILDILVSTDFCHEWSLSGLDLAYFTEVDPVWNNDELGVLLYAESAIFANPLAQAICPIDCITASANYPLNDLFWCAGCWGSLYPMTGSTASVDSPISTSSLQMSRLLGRLARYPIPPAVEWDTSSSLAKCGGVIRPFLKKSQYRISTVTPIPETKSYHSLGASSLLWGENRTIPSTGEDHTFVTWRKRNCCLRLVSTAPD